MPISVLICCYNGERFLRETLDSVLAQSLPPLEVIVVDDGSTDTSAEIARSYGEPVRVISQTNRGLPASRNVAIQAARGRYLIFIDADDLIHPTSLERLHAAIESRDDVVAIMGFVPFGQAAGPAPAEQLYDFEDFFPAILYGNFGPQHNRLVSKELALRAGCFDPTMFYFEDWLFWCRVALCGARLAPVSFVGAYYRRHDATMSDTAPSIAFIRGHVRVMEELGEAILERPDLLNQWSQHTFWCAWTALHRARQASVPWRELVRLRRVLREIVRRGSPELRRSRLAKMMDIIGVRAAESLRNLTGRLAGLSDRKEPVAHP